MNVRQLKYYISIVDEGSVSSAARVLRIAQPALSQHIANLEAELTTDLLIRSSRGVRPTKAGEVLYQHARKIMSQLKQATDDVRKEAELPRGEVAVVLPPMLGSHIAPRLLENVSREYPEIDLRIMEEHALGEVEMIESGRVDLGILAMMVPNPRIDYQYIYTEPLYLVSRRREHHRECDGQCTIDFERLFSVPLVLSQRNHQVRSMVEQTAQEFDKSLDIRIATESTRLRISYVRSGITSGIMPWPSFDSNWRRGEICAMRITKPELTRNVYLAWPKNQPLNAATKVLRDQTLRICDELIEAGVIRGTVFGRDGNEPES